MPYHNPLKVITPLSRWWNWEVVQGFKPQLECLDLLCLWSTVLDGPQCTQTNQTLIEIFYLQMPLYHYLSSTHAHASLSLLLPVFLDSSISGQMFSGGVTAVRDKMWLFYLCCDQGRAKTLRSQRPWAKKVFIEAKQSEAMIILEGCLLEGETRRRRQAALLRFLFHRHAFPRNRKRVDWPLPYGSPGLPRQHWW